MLREIETTVYDIERRSSTFWWWFGSGGGAIRKLRFFQLVEDKNQNRYVHQWHNKNGHWFGQPMIPVSNPRGDLAFLWRRRRRRRVGIMITRQALVLLHFQNQMLWSCMVCWFIGIYSCKEQQALTLSLVTYEVGINIMLFSTLNVIIILFTYLVIYF